MIKKTVSLCIVLVGALLAACQPAPTAGSAVAVESTITPVPLAAVQPTPESKPAITIDALPGGEEAVLGQEFLIQSTASDEVGVTRIDLYVDDVLRRTDTAPEPGGRTSLSVLQPWIPIMLGERTISVVAYRADGTASDPASVVVNVVEGGLAPDPTPTVCTARTVVELNARTGPGIDYPVVRVLGLGEEVAVTGRNEGSFWWRIADSWISAAYTTVEGDCASLPLASYDPPPPAVASGGEAAAIPVPPTTGGQNSGAADLAVTAIEMPSRITLSPGGGTPVSIRVTVANLGQQPSGAFRTVMFPTGQGGPQGRVDLPPVANLRPGESTTLSVNYAYTVAGSFNVMAVVDPNNQVGDRDGRNNARTLAVRVRALAPSPTISLSPDQGGAGSRITISGAGFPANSGVTITFGPTQATANARLASGSGVAADADGEFTIVVVLPGQWPDGSPITGSALVIQAQAAGGQWFAWQTLDYGPGT